MSLSVSSVGTAPPQIISGASAYASPTIKMSNLFQQIDSTNSGSISLAQFQQAFSTLGPPPKFQLQGADSIFTQLDPTGSGSVSKADFVSGMAALMKSLANSATSSTTPTADSVISSDAAQSLSQSLQSFLQLGGQLPLIDSGLGNVLDAWS